MMLRDVSSIGFCLLTSAVFAADPAPVYRPAQIGVAEADIRAWIGFLATTELAGRASGEAGYDVAARYVASELERAGLEGGALDGSFFQEFRLLESSRLGDAARLTFKAPGGEERSIALAPSDVWVPDATRSLSWDGAWAVAGRGFGADRDGRDDFSGIDAAGSVVIIAPDETDDTELRGAIAAGVRRLIVVSDLKCARSNDQRFRRGRGLAHRIDEAAELKRLERGLDVVYLSRRAVEPLFEAWGSSVARVRAGHPSTIALDGANAQLELPFERVELVTRNVVAKLAGSDRALASEHVVVGAHLDHVGAHDGVVFFGADDNASGTSAVLGVAKALASLPVRPRRSVLFVLFGAEEIGLLGSRSFVDRPPVPLDKIAFMVNLDMIGRNEEHDEELAADNVNSLHVVGDGALSRELGGWIQRINEDVGFAFERDEDRVLRRSDHWSFIQAGIPSVFFFSGFHPDYHRPTDTPEKINYAKVVKVCQLVIGLVYEISDRARRPSINRV